MTQAELPLVSREIALNDIAMHDLVRVRAALFILWTLVHFCHGLKINHLWVPKAMLNGSADSAVLDCDYTLDDRDKDSLEVKWYFRHDPTPIFQWVPPYPPQAGGGFGKYLNLDYEATSDPYTKHRALHIRPLSTQVSGRYGCRVSSNYMEDFASKDMILYIKPRILDMKLFWLKPQVLNATCNAVDVYPEPRIRIFLVSLTSTNQSGYDITDQATLDRVVEWSEQGLYSLRVSALLRFPMKLSIFEKQTLDAKDRLIGHQFITSASSVKVACHFAIPGTNFVREMAQKLPPEPVPNLTSISGGTTCSMATLFWLFFLSFFVAVWSSLDVL